MQFPQLSSIIRPSFSIGQSSALYTTVTKHRFWHIHITVNVASPIATVEQQSRNWKSSLTNCYRGATAKKIMRSYGTHVTKSWINVIVPHRDWRSFHCIFWSPLCYTVELVFKGRDSHTLWLHEVWYICRVCVIPTFNGNSLIHLSYH